MPGPIYPIWSMDVLPGDDIRVNVKAIVESLPMRAPMLGGGKATFAFYWCPWSNYYRFMDNNERSSTEDIINRKRHTFNVGVSTGAGAAFTVDDMFTYVKLYAVQPGTIMDFLGIPPGFIGNVKQLSATSAEISPISVPAEKILSYIDIVRNYYVNNQENSILRMESNDQFGDYTPVLLSSLDQLMADVRMFQDGTDLSERLGDYIFNSRGSVAKPGAGLFLRSYKMDLLRGIMNSSVGSYKSVVNVQNGQISMETIRFANKLQAEIDKIDITGGRFSEYMRSRWNVAPKNDMDRPVFLGSVASYIGNRDIVATATSSDQGGSSSGVDSLGASRLGQQAGFSVGTVDQNRPVRLRADQYGTLMCVFSYVPYVDYSQGFELNDMKTTFADIYSPSMGQLGFQDVSRLELSALPELRSLDFETADSSVTIPKMDGSVGKRVAWSEYMAALNRNHGQFAYGRSLDFWVYNRMYSTELSISNGKYQNLLPYGPFDSTTYVKPVLWNQLFDDVSSRAENYRLQANFEVFAKRPIGKRLMPHL